MPIEGHERLMANQRIRITYGLWVLAHVSFLEQLACRMRLNSCYPFVFTSKGHVLNLLP